MTMIRLDKARPTGTLWTLTLDQCPWSKSQPPEINRRPIPLADATSQAKSDGRREDAIANADQASSTTHCWRSWSESAPCGAQSRSRRLFTIPTRRTTYARRTLRRMSVASCGPAGHPRLMCTRDWQRQAAVTRTSTLSTEPAVARPERSAADSHARSDELGQHSPARGFPRRAVHLQTVAK